ncbi:MAG: hypothetical protein AB1755_01780 [Candidatus Omnitrophota bacterium]
MKKIWVNIAHSFKEAEESDIKFYLAMSGAKKLALMQSLREDYYKIKGKYGIRKGLQRVIKVIQ